MKGIARWAVVVVVAFWMGISVHKTLTTSHQMARPEPPVVAWSSGAFYVDPNNPAAEWVREHPWDPRADVIRERIASQPQSAWFGTTAPYGVGQQVSNVVGRAVARAKIPILVSYAIPHRDCGKASSGGVGDLAGYRTWIDDFSEGLGSAHAVVIVEPDALAQMGCLDKVQKKNRFEALSYAGRTLARNNPHAKIYYDAGNSAWQPAEIMADRLRRAGIFFQAHGIVLNVSNFNWTAHEIRYGRSVLARLGDPDLRMVIDTSRNGNGPAPGHRFCDPPGRKLGVRPTTDTDHSLVDAFLWVKRPGQADGCRGRPGQFLPAYAYELAVGEPRGLSPRALPASAARTKSGQPPSEQARDRW